MQMNSIFVPTQSVVEAEMLRGTFSVKEDLGLNPEQTNRNHVGEELRKRAKQQKPSE